MSEFSLMQPDKSSSHMQSKTVKTVTTWCRHSYKGPGHYNYILSVAILSSTQTTLHIILKGVQTYVAKEN